MEKKLNLQQAICSARIFLNIFGFILEENVEIKEDSKLRIWDATKKKVGELFFEKEKVYMKVSHQDYSLEASYAIPVVLRIIDIDYNDALFGTWKSKIHFLFQKQNQEKLSGEVLIDSSIDTEYGLKCSCHPLIHYELPSREVLTLKLLRNGSLFSLDYEGKEEEEHIRVNPWNDWNGYFIHDIKSGHYDIHSGTYSYRKYAGIFTGAESGEDKNKLHIYLEEQEESEQLSYRNEWVLKNGDENSKECLLQKAKLMQAIDPDMFQKIKKIKEKLQINSVSLLDNLIRVCCDSYDDEEILNLLGLQRKKMNYQNGFENLKASYFGIGKENPFIEECFERKLLKKN